MAAPWKFARFAGIRQTYQGPEAVSKHRPRMLACRLRRLTCSPPRREIEDPQSTLADVARPIAVDRMPARTGSASRPLRQHSG